MRITSLRINTVHKAYRELEREGLVRARPRLGTFVTRAPSGPDPATQAWFLTELTGWLRSARSAVLGPDDIEAIYRTAFRSCFAEGAA
jgi:GntR family transcriptional regulator